MRSQRKRATAATISAVMKTLRRTGCVELGESLRRPSRRNFGRCDSPSPKPYSASIFYSNWVTRVRANHWFLFFLTPTLEWSMRNVMDWLGSRAPSNTRRNSRARFSSHHGNIVSIKIDGKVNPADISRHLKSIQESHRHQGYMRVRSKAYKRTQARRTIRRVDETTTPGSFRRNVNGPRRVHFPPGFTDEIWTESSFAVDRDPAGVFYCTLIVLTIGGIFLYSLGRT